MCVIVSCLVIFFHSHPYHNNDTRAREVIIAIFAPWECVQAQRAEISQPTIQPSTVVRVVKPQKRLRLND